MLLSLMVLFSSCSLFKSEFIEITSITQAENTLRQADQNTLVVFDIDQTLIDPAMKCGQPRYQQNKIFQKYRAELEQYLAERRKIDPFYGEIFESKIWQSSFELVEPKTLDIIKSLQARGIKIVALTSTQPGRFGIVDRMDIERSRNLKSVGIDFSTSFKDQGVELKGLKPYIGNYPTYYKGIICPALNAGNTKGTALIAFFDAIKWTPKKVIFFDDSKNNVISVADEMRAHAIPCVAFLYRAAFIPAKDSLDESLVRFQMDYLRKHDTVLTDEEAAAMMHKDDTAETQQVGFAD
jgi:FMN phosphatase YigB (HAD superfamily)